jgi:hypothetical protein
MNKPFQPPDTTAATESPKTVPLETNSMVAKTKMSKFYTVIFYTRIKTARAEPTHASIHALPNQSPRVNQKHEFGFVMF